MGRFVAQLVGGKAMETIHARMLAPMADGRGERILREVLYPGTGRQFDEERGYQGGRVIVWPDTKPFGNSPAPAKTLHRSEKYKRAWMGGAGSTSQVTENGVTYGVDRSLFPQVVVFQRDRPTTVKAKKRGKTGRLAMQMKLGMEFDVWVSERRLLTIGFTNRPRPVGISPQMEEDARRLLAKMLVAR